MEIAAWGDSITYGENDSEGLGWVGRLRKSFPVDDYVGVYNRGVCGDTSEGLLKRFSVEASSIETDKILFAIGINDSKFPEGQNINKVPLDTFKENLLKLIQQARKFTSDIYIVSATKVDESSLQSKSRFLNTEILKYNEVLKETAQNENLKYIDVFNLLSPEDLYDGLHPNANGYEKLYILIQKTL
jgi:acyl-CoA thioesterase-1